MSISFSNLKYSLSLHCPWTESLSIVTPSSKLTSLMRIKWSAMDGILMRSWVLVWRSFPWGFSRGRLIGGGSNTPIPDLPWTSHLKPYLLHLQLHMWSDFPLLFQLQNFVPLVIGVVLFLFLERLWSCLILWVFCVFISQENFWIYRLLEIGLVIVFMCLFLGFIYGLVSWIYFLYFWWWRLDLVTGFGFGVS